MANFAFVQLPTRLRFQYLAWITALSLNHRIVVPVKECKIIAGPL